jgi:hypothetical protein
MRSDHSESAMSDRQEWSSRCDLCSNARVLVGSGFGDKPDVECPWCKAVRLKYGNYWYPKRELAKMPPPAPTLEQRVQALEAAIHSLSHFSQRTGGGPSKP